MRVRGLAAMLRNRAQRRQVYASPGFWDAKAREYRGSSVSLWHNAHLNDLYHPIHVRLIERHLPDLAGRRVLDLGCGTGRLSRELARRGAEVVGLDFSAAAIEIARRESPPGNPRFLVRSVRQLDDLGPFDAVVMFGVACVACRDLEALRDLLSCMHRAVKPHGTALVFEPLHGRWLGLVLAVTKREFLAAVREAGFEVRATRDLHFWPVHQLLCNFAWPRWVTRAGFRLGQGALGLLGGRAMGEVKFVHATRRPAAPPEV